MCMTWLGNFAHKTQRDTVRLFFVFVNGCHMILPFYMEKSCEWYGMCFIESTTSSQRMLKIGMSQQLQTYFCMAQCMAPVFGSMMLWKMWLVRPSKFEAPRGGLHLSARLSHCDGSNQPQTGPSLPMSKQSGQWIVKANPFLLYRLLKCSSEPPGGRLYRHTRGATCIFGGREKELCWEARSEDVCLFIASLAFWDFCFSTDCRVHSLYLPLSFGMTLKQPNE